LAALTRSGTIAPQAAALLDDIIGARLGPAHFRRYGGRQDDAVVRGIGRRLPRNERIVCVEGRRPNSSLHIPIWSSSSRVAPMSKASAK